MCLFVLISLYCINPSDFDFPKDEIEAQIANLNFDVMNFDTIYNSLLTNLTFLTFTGWGMITTIVNFKNILISDILKVWLFSESIFIRSLWVKPSFLCVIYS